MRRAAFQECRGFSILDAIVVLLVVGMVVGMGLVFNGCQRARTVSYRLTCATRVNQIHKGLVLFANDSGGVYPVPSALSPETAALAVQTGNSSANFYSYMIFNTYYSPEIVTCDEDTSPNLAQKTDYRYGSMDDSNWNNAWKWDPAFSADITQPDANASYATLAMIGDRRANQWRDSLDPNFAVVADRGPKDGVWDASSVTMKNHGDTKDWVGNVAFNDGHVQKLTFTAKDQQPFTFNGDNLFRVDDSDKGADMWLGLFGATDEISTTPYWD